MKIIVPPTPPAAVEIEIDQPNELMKIGRKFRLRGGWLAYAAEVIDPSMIGNGTLIFVPNLLPDRVLTSLKD